MLYCRYLGRKTTQRLLKSPGRKSGEEPRVMTGRADGSVGLAENNILHILNIFNKNKRTETTRAQLLSENIFDVAVYDAIL